MTTTRNLTHLLRAISEDTLILTPKKDPNQ